jgi:hypothetical protein
MKKIYLVSSWTGVYPPEPKAFIDHTMAVRYAKKLISCMDKNINWSVQAAIGQDRYWQADYGLPVFEGGPDEPLCVEVKVIELSEAKARKRNTMDHNRKADAKEIIEDFLDVVGFGTERCCNDDSLEYCPHCNKEFDHDWAKEVNGSPIEDYHEPDCSFLKLVLRARDFIDTKQKSED